MVELSGKQRLRKHARLNRMVGRLRSKPVSVSLDRDDDSPQVISPSQSLFTHLATQSCRAGAHRAFLRLSGWDPEDKSPIFHLLLSCPSITEADSDVQDCHEVLCTYESQEPAFISQSSIDLCSKVRRSQKLRAPLRLSFNQSKLWETFESNQPLELLPRKERKQVALKHLLRAAHPSPVDRLKRFRLAFRLASSLHQLYLGPWAQDPWTVGNLHVFHQQGVEPSRNMEEVYIRCLFTENWQRSNASIQDARAIAKDRFPTFFLSFAQLLVDIAQGATCRHLSVKDNPRAWFDYLANQVVESFQEDELMVSYRRAIQGCLFYSIHYDVEGPRTLDMKLRAQTVIYREIVSHLPQKFGILQSKMEGVDGRVNEERRCPSDSYARHPCLARTHEGTGTPSSSPLTNHGDDDDAEWTDRMPKTTENDFTAHMDNFLDTFVIPYGGVAGDSRNVRIAVLDTGLNVDDNDYLLQGAMSRIKMKKDFSGSGDEDCQDRCGHGTHVARLLLRFAPQADVFIAKISNSRSLEGTRLRQLAEALRWAGKHADIINLSFGLRRECLEPTSTVDLGSEIDRLVMDKKLIFAAASNTGANGSRSWPASQRGVFCIHATNERGVANPGLNPVALSHQDNFATLGDTVRSHWDGKSRCISGTSFATPVAAAVAANVLEFARQHLARDHADVFARYGVMRRLFRDHMTDNGGSDGVYHYIKPWRTGLWDEGADVEAIAKKLTDISIYLST